MSNGGVPEGWVRKVCKRTSGRTAGKCDVYIYSPQGRRFRSRRELAAYLRDTNSALPISEFNFSAANDAIRDPGCTGRASPTCPPGDRETLPRGEPSPSEGDKASTSGDSATSAWVSVPPAPFEGVSEEATARPNEERTTATPLGEDPHTREETGETRVNAADKPDPASSADDSDDLKVRLKFESIERIPKKKFPRFEPKPTAGYRMTPKDDPQRGRAIEAERPQLPEDANGKSAVQYCEPKKNPMLSLTPQQKNLKGETSSKECHRLGPMTTPDAKPNAEKNTDQLSSTCSFTKLEPVPAAKTCSTFETEQPDAKDESRPGPSLVDKKEGMPSKGSIELEAKPTGEEKHNSEPNKQPCGALTGGAHRVDEAPSTSGQSPVDKKLKLKRKISEDADKFFTKLHLIKREAKPNP